MGSVVECTTRVLATEVASVPCMPVHVKRNGDRKDSAAEQTGRFVYVEYEDFPLPVGEYSFPSFLARHWSDVGMWYGSAERETDDGRIVGARRVLLRTDEQRTREELKRLVLSSLESDVECLVTLEFPPRGGDWNRDWMASKQYCIAHGRGKLMGTPFPLGEQPSIEVDTCVTDGGVLRRVTLRCGEAVWSRLDPYHDDAMLMPDGSRVIDVVGDGGRHLVRALWRAYDDAIAASQPSSHPVTRG